MKYSCLILWVALVAGVASQGIYQLIARENAQKNLILSPFSIETALSMVYMGAKGRTAQELRQALDLPEYKHEVAWKYRELINNLRERKNAPILKLANRIFVNSIYSLNPEYNREVRESFKAVAEPINLFDGGQKAAKYINQWVLDHTGGRIKDIVSPDSLSSDVKVVVVNALYFNGRWKKQFHSMIISDFHLTSKRIVPVPMMFQHGRFLAGDFPDLQAKVLELPYDNSNLSMVIFLPYSIDGLKDLEEKIVGFSRPLQYKMVMVNLPRFKIEFSISLQNTLKKMGIRDLFTSNSKLGGLFQNNDEAQVNEVLHKAFIEVDEYGTEAAAATSVQVGTLSALHFDMYFMADHPFAFIIRDEKNIYFQGHVVKPLIKFPRQR